MTYNRQVQRNRQISAKESGTNTTEILGRVYGGVYVTIYEKYY